MRNGVLSALSDVLFTVPTIETARYHSLDETKHISNTFMLNFVTLFFLLHLQWKINLKLTNLKQLQLVKKFTFRSNLDSFYVKQKYQKYKI